MPSNVQTYQEAIQDYVARFDTLFQAPAKGGPATTRGTADGPIERLIEKADGIAEASSNVLTLAEPYLESDDYNEREGISADLLAQAAAELQLAFELLQVAAEEEQGEAIAKGGPTRAARGAALSDTVRAMRKTLESPLSAGQPVAVRKAVRAMPADPDVAKRELKDTAELTTDTISQRVVETGSRLLIDLIFQTDWLKVLGGTVMTRKDISEQLAKAEEGASALAQKAISTAEKTFLNAYDKMLAMLGKDGQDLARKKVQQWLEQIEKEQEEDKKIGILGKAVANLYQVDSLNAEMEGWLAETQAAVTKINQGTEQVDLLADKFISLVGQVQLVAKVLTFVKLVPMPVVLTIYVGFQVGLLTTLVYAGYDYIGHKQVGFVDITKGVAQIIRETLGA